MQHGQACSKAEDPERPLNAQGRFNVERMRKLASEITVLRVVHSGKLRAQQTAEIMARALGVPCAAREGLSPNDPVAPAREWLEAQDSTLVVGHLPFLDRLLNLMLSAPTESGLVVFRNAGIVCLEKGQLQWAVWPQHLA